MPRHVPKWALVGGLAAIVLAIYLRRRAAAKADPVNQFASGATPIMPIPVSFSYLHDAANPPGGVVAAPGIDASSLALLQQLQNALISNAAFLAGGMPRSIGVSPSRVPTGGGTSSSTPTGLPGEGNFARITNPSQLDVSGGWGVTWTGPGTYEARKFPATVAGGGSDTRWVRVG